MTRDKSKVTVTIEKTDTGFSAFAKDFPVYTTGKSLAELQRNIHEALNFYFEDENKQINYEDINLEIDLRQFFQYYKVINAKFLADRISMNPTLLSQYVQGRKKPSVSQTERILVGIREIGRELSELSLTAR